MKILVIHDDASESGGANTFRKEFSRILKSLGIEVYLFTYKAGTEENPGRDYCYQYSDKIKFVRHLSRYYFNPALFFSLKKFIKKVSPDLIHIHHNNVFTNSVLIACAGSIPVVQTVHDHRIICHSGRGITRDRQICTRKAGIACYSESCLSLLEYFRRFIPDLLNRFLMKKVVNAFLVPSNDLKNKMLSFGFNATLLRHYADTSLYSPVKTYMENDRVLFVGRMNEGKGMGVLMESFKDIVEKIPGAKLDIVGEDEEEQKYERLAHDLGIEKSVVFHGHKPFEIIPEYYARANLVVLPASWIENSPLVILEAMASGRPVVAGRIGGIPEIVIDGKTGFLCNPGDSVDFTKKILHLLKNKGLAMEMGIKGRERIEKHFSTEDHMKGYFNIIKEISGDSFHELNQFVSSNETILKIR